MGATFELSRGSRVLRVYVSVLVRVHVCVLAHSYLRVDARPSRTSASKCVLRACKCTRVHSWTCALTRWSRALAPQTCVCTYLYVCIYIYIYIYTHTYTYTHHVCVCALMCMCAYLCARGVHSSHTDTETFAYVYNKIHTPPSLPRCKADCVWVGRKILEAKGNSRSTTFVQRGKRNFQTAQNGIFPSIAIFAGQLKRNQLYMHAHLPSRILSPKRSHTYTYNTHLSITPRGKVPAELFIQMPPGRLKYFRPLKEHRYARHHSYCCGRPPHTCLCAPVPVTSSAYAVYEVPVQRGSASMCVCMYVYIYIYIYIGMYVCFFRYVKYVWLSHHIWVFEF